MIDPVDVPRIVRKMHDVCDCLFAVACQGEWRDDPDLNVVGSALHRGIHTFTDDEFHVVEQAMRRLAARFGGGDW